MEINLYSFNTPIVSVKCLFDEVLYNFYASFNTPIVSVKYGKKYKKYPIAAFQYSNCFGEIFTRNVFNGL